MFQLFRKFSDERAGQKLMGASDSSGAKTTSFARQLFRGTLANDRFRESTRDPVGSHRFSTFRVLDKHSRMNLLESDTQRRDTRSSGTANLGGRAKFVVFCSVAIGSP